MSKTITIPREEYEKLNRIAEKYEVVRQALAFDIFEKPLTRNSTKVIKDFKATGRYNQDFLRSLLQGLRESSYFAKPRPK